MKMWIATVAAMAAIGTGSAAMAQTATGDAMHGDAMSATMPTMVCRAAQKGETATAHLSGGGDIVCKKVDMAKMMKGPDTAANTTKAAEDAAWQKELMQIQLPLNGSPG